MSSPFVLHSPGYEVLQAMTDKEAIDLCKDRSQIDLFVCDVAIGCASGTEVALQLCKVHADVPVLFVSGTPKCAWQQHDVNNFLKLPLDFVECLEKPFRPSALIAKANELLARRALRRGGQTAGDAS